MTSEREAERREHARADENGDGQNRRREKQDREAASTILLPMLISGLVLIVIGMVIVMIFA